MKINYALFDVQYTQKLSKVKPIEEKHSIIQNL